MVHTFENLPNGLSLEMIKASSELIAGEGLEKLGALLRSGQTSGSHGERAATGHRHFEQWLELNTFLNRYIFEQEGGRLGQLLLNLTEMPDEQLSETEHLLAATQIIKYTAHIPRQLAPLIDQLTAVSSGTRDQTVDMICGPDECPSGIGLLVRLAERMRIHGVEGAADWDLKRPGEGVAPVLMVSDPFDPRYLEKWMEKMPTTAERRPIFELSEARTEDLLDELKGMIEGLRAGKRTDKDELIMNYEIIADWLEEQMVYYRDGNETELGQYHFGHEKVSDLMGILGALDAVKHHAPPLFAQMLGVNPYAGDHASPYWGSFLHKAIANTQAVVGEGNQRNLMVKTMLDELLTMDKHVTLYSGQVTEENLRTLTKEVARRVESTSGNSGKGQVLMMVAPLLMRASFEAQVHKELADLQRKNYKQETERLERALADHEHPLMTMKIISETPLPVLQGPLRDPLQALFPLRLKNRAAFERLKEDCRTQEPEVVKALFDAIPTYVVHDDGQVDHGPLVRTAALCAGSYDTPRLFQHPRYRSGDDFLKAALKGRHVQRGIFRPASRGDKLISAINVNRYSAKLAMWKNPEGDPVLFQDKVAALVTAGKPCPEDYSSEERVEYVSIYLAYKQKDLAKLPTLLEDEFLASMSSTDRSTVLRRIVGHVKAVQVLDGVKLFWGKRLYRELEKTNCTDELKWSVPRIVEEPGVDGFDAFLKDFSPAGAKVFLVEMQTCESEITKRRVLRIFAADETLRVAVRECGVLYIHLYPSKEEIIRDAKALPREQQYYWQRVTENLVERLSGEDRLVLLVIHSNERDFMQTLLVDRLQAVNTGHHEAWDERSTHSAYYSKDEKRKTKEQEVADYDAEVTKRLGFSPRLILEAIPEEERLGIFEAIAGEGPLELGEKLLNYLDALTFDEICLYMFTPGRPAKIYERLPEMWTKPSIRPRYRDMCYRNHLAEQLGFGMNGNPMRVAFEKRVRKKLGLGPEEECPLGNGEKSVYHLAVKLAEALEAQPVWWENFKNQFRSMSTGEPRVLRTLNMYLGQVFDLWPYGDSMRKLIAGKELELADLFLDPLNIPEEIEKDALYDLCDYLNKQVIISALLVAYPSLSTEQKTKVLRVCQGEGYHPTQLLKRLTGSNELVKDVMAVKPSTFTPHYTEIKDNPDAKAAYMAYLSENPEDALHMFDVANPERSFFNQKEKKAFSEDLADILSATPETHRGQMLRAACDHIGNEFGALDRAENEFVNMCPVDEREELKVYIRQKKDEYEQIVVAWAEECRAVDAARKKLREEAQARRV